MNQNKSTCEYIHNTTLYINDDTEENTNKVVESINNSETKCNTCIKMISVRELQNLNVIIPSFQRIINQTKIDEISTYQIEHYKETGEFFFTCLQLIQLDEKYFLIDGQHRYLSAIHLHNTTGHNIWLPISITKTYSLEKLKQYYCIINMNTKLPDFDIEQFDKVSIQNICNYFQNKYPKIWSSKENSHRPYIYFNAFQDAIIYIQNNTTLNEMKIIELIETFNNNLANSSFIELKRRFDITNTMYEHAKKLKFFIGLNKCNIEISYRYYWANYITQVSLGKPIGNDKNQYKKKKSINKSLRNSIWKKYIGSNNNEHFCICCGNESINIMNFECGHIISEYNGGTIEETNLLPICKICNNSMSKKNMDQFITECFPENMDNFLARKYHPIEKDSKVFFPIFF